MTILKRQQTSLFPPSFHRHLSHAPLWPPVPTLKPPPMPCSAPRTRTAAALTTPDLRFAASRNQRSRPDVNRSRTLKDLLHFKHLTTPRSSHTRILQFVMHRSHLTYALKTRTSFRVRLAKCHTRHAYYPTNESARAYACHPQLSLASPFRRGRKDS